MRPGGLTDRYVKALVGLDLKGVPLTQLHAELVRFGDCFRDSGDLRRLLENPAFTLSQRKATIAALGRRLGLGKAAGDVLSLLTEKHRIGLLPEIVDGLGLHIAAKSGVVRAKVVAASPLTPDQQSRLVAVLSKLRGGPVQVSTRVDTALIGGAVVEMDGVVYDGSIGRRLALIREDPQGG